MIALSLLLILIVYIYLAKATVKAVGKRYPGWLAKSIVLAVFVLLPTWDIVPGQLYFNHLCKTEAGQKIYKTVEVGPEYILKPGEPDRSKSNVPPAVGGELNRPKLQERYQLGDERRVKPWNVTEVYFFVKDKQTGELLGSATSFTYYGGWLRDSLEEHRSLANCPQEESDPNFLFTLPEKIFKQMKSFKDEGLKNGG